MKTNNSNNTGIIILAAGSSSRLGTAKQLLPYAGTTLLQHSLQTALATNANTIVVVLGANAAIIKENIKNTTAHIVVNEEWQEGMASSIRCGIQALSNIDPNVQGAILLVCDQPFVNTSLLNNLIVSHHKTGKPIVACNYENTFGPPVFFHKSIFPELLLLKGDKGAKNIVQQHAGEMGSILFPEGNIDIDTADDYQKLSARTSKILFDH